MDNLLVQNFLLKNSLETLREIHGVRHSLSSDGTKVSLNYHQIEAKENDELACECRGLILCKNDRSKINPEEIFGSSRVLAFPFKRFFNFGQQSSETKLDLSSTIVWEKVDGTLCIVYYDDKSWCVATRSVSDADIPIDGFLNYTFSGLFKKALQDTTGLSFEDFTSNLSVTNTYIFELMTPVNRVVVNHNDYLINLIGVRSLLTYREFSYDSLVKVSKANGIPLPARYELKSFDELIKFVNSRKPDEYEGVVLCDNNFNRVKLKSADYVAFNKVHDIVKSPIGILRIILDEKMDDYATYLSPHAKNIADKISEDLKNFISETDLAIEELFHLHAHSDRKTVALYVQNHARLSRVMSHVMRMWANGKKEHTADWILSNKNHSQGLWEDAFLRRLLKLCSPNFTE